MTIIARNFQQEQGLPYVLEDPDENQDRIWINTLGYTSSTLTPLYDKPNSMFSRNYLRPMASNTNTYPIASLTNLTTRLVITNRGFIANNYYSQVAPLWATYHWSLDYNYYPNKIIWKSQNNRFIASDILTGSIVTTTSASTQISNTYREYKLNDFTTPVTSTDTYTNSGTAAILTMTGMVYEDVAGGRLYGFCGDWMNAPRIRYFNSTVSYSYDTVGAGLTESWAGTMNVNTFFVGADSSNNTYWAFISSNAATESFTLSRYTGATGTTVIASTNAGGVTTYARPWPSNVRRDSASRRVFYVPMFDASSVLVPRRIVWDPTQANTATLTACTMTYASGNYLTYSKKIAGTVTSYSGGQNNSWRTKGHQFKVGSNWYITFIASDAAYSNGGSTRFPDTLTLTALTYSIGSGTNDDQLTYHSGFAFTATTLSKDWIPINPDGNRLAIIQQDNKVGFMTFSESTGWSIVSTYDVTCSAIGVDKYWRVWVTSTDPLSLGQGLVHIVTPEVPITYTITTASQSFSYEGNNIATTATVNAYNYLGARVATTVDLIITGTGMIFTSNSAKSLQITTSASADTTVNLTINGTGVSNIVATAAI